MTIIIIIKEVKIKMKIKFKCSVCGVESWFDVDLETYIVSITDLVCDDCNPCEAD